VTVGKDGDDVCRGVTVILPRHPDEIHIPCYAGMHTLNGNGEVSGSYQIADWGYTNTVRFSALQTSRELKYGSLLLSQTLSALVLYSTRSGNGL
jgi:hypothetical protein